MSTLDLMLIISYLLLLISVFVLIQIAQYHTRTMANLDKQIQYWRQQALNESNFVHKRLPQCKEPLHNHHDGCPVCDKFEH